MDIRGVNKVVGRFEYLIQKFNFLLLMILIRYVIEIPKKFLPYAVLFNVPTVILYNVNNSVIYIIAHVY